ncbi:MAG: glycerol-3-phosphate 1-O-acyltransferase PlsY [Ottowia sp.]|nr:glycerol-3-phosphate 1-O-acyltransferase PlsY [Ottowia sp.]
MPLFFWQFVAIVGGYLLGSVSFAVLVSRVFGLNDPRSYGSGNPGATNVLRSGSKAAAIAVLVLDVLKGLLPVALVLHIGPDYGLTGAGAAALTGLAAFVGHLYPVFFGFKGGKGVATALGVVLALSPWLALAVLVVFGVVLAATRYVSLASMSAAAAAPLIMLLPGPWGHSVLAVVAFLVMAALLIWRHRANIERLRAGTEAKFGSKKA